MSEASKQAQMLVQRTTGNARRNVHDRHNLARQELLGYIATLEAENEGLVEALKGLRRSNGHGGQVDCFCDSERGRNPTHADYCKDARRALEETGERAEETDHE